MISIFQNIAPVLALVLILSGAVVGADIGNVWQAPLLSETSPISWWH